MLRYLIFVHGDDPQARQRQNHCMVELGVYVVPTLCKMCCDFKTKLRSIVLAEAKLNVIVYLCTPDQLFVLYRCSIPGTRQAWVEVLLTFLKRRTHTYTDRYTDTLTGGGYRVRQGLKIIKYFYLTQILYKNNLYLLASQVSEHPLMPKVWKQNGRIIMLYIYVQLSPQNCSVYTKWQSIHNQHKPSRLTRLGCGINYGTLSAQCICFVKIVLVLY